MIRLWCFSDGLDKNTYLKSRVAYRLLEKTSPAHASEDVPKSQVKNAFAIGGFIANGVFVHGVTSLTCDGIWVQREEWGRGRARRSRRAVGRRKRSRSSMTHAPKASNPLLNASSQEMRGSHVWRTVSRLRRIDTARSDSQGDNGAKGRKRTQSRLPVCQSINGSLQSEADVRRRKAARGSSAGADTGRS